MWRDATQELLRTKLEEFFQARIEEDPRYFDSLPGTKDLSLLETYEEAFAKVRKQVRCRGCFGKRMR